MTLAVQNFAVYCLQVAILVAIGGLLPFAGRLESVRARSPGGRCRWLPACVLPLVQPWKQIVIYTSMTLAPRARSLSPPPRRSPVSMGEGCWRCSASESWRGCCGLRSASTA
jgi:hypothetical protein